MTAIDTMTGPELDRAVAVEVMGWRDDGHDRWMALDGFGAWISEWHPSTDIAHAWRVVEKMRELGWDYGLRRYDGIADGWHEASFGTGFGEVEAETAPLAICRAALMCVRGES